MSGAWEKNVIDVLIAHSISGWETVPYEWHTNQASLIIPNGLRVQRARFPEPMVDISRDKAKEMAVQNGARWLFFVDTDILMPPDTLTRLIAHDADIVSALYVRRHNPPFNEMLRFRADGQGIEPIRDGEYKPGSLVECDCVATGCVLIKTEVFERVPPFQITIDGQPARPRHFLWTEFNTQNGMSEDFAFMTRARRAGARIYCDTSISLRHCGPIKFVPSGSNTLSLEFMGG